MKNPRMLAMPLLVMAVAGMIWLATRPGPPKVQPNGPEKLPPNRERAAKLVEEGRELFEKARETGPGWDVKVQTALRKFRDAITADPDHLPAREWSARAALLAGALMQAEDDADRILKREPTNLTARELRGQARWRLAFGFDAHVLPRKLERWKTTREPVAFAKSAVDLRKGAAEDFAAAKAYYPLAVAEEHYRAGRLEEARRLAEAADPRVPEAGLMLGLISLENGENPLVYLETSSRRLMPPRLLLARMAIEREDWETARQQVEAITANDLYTRSPDAYLYLGLAQRKLGKEKEAQKSFEWAKQLDPDVAGWVPK
jgi:tetratricopeptide (TPR) repeat protein